jgi:DnaK suppressor protein
VTEVERSRVTERRPSMEAHGVLDRPTVKALERVLRAKQADLVETLRSAVSARRTAEVRSTEDLLGRATVTLDDELGAALLDRLNGQLAQIEAALHRLDREEYGFCHECGEFIGVARLEALPFAGRCGGCQEGAESRTRRLGVRS